MHCRLMRIVHSTNETNECKEQDGVCLSSVVKISGLLSVKRPLTIGSELRASSWFAPLAHPLSLPLDPRPHPYPRLHFLPSALA